mmetsp:Transcript_56128/g.100913  ORF Transcript_56128/g.100913 Transcript_56128/m.100913 type:complete len:337 (-) Transcript_56128:343-1353(-)
MEFVLLPDHEPVIWCLRATHINVTASKRMLELLAGDESKPTTRVERLHSAYVDLANEIFRPGATDEARCRCFRLRFLQDHIPSLRLPAVTHLHVEAHCSADLDSALHFLVEETIATVDSQDFRALDEAEALHGAESLDRAKVPRIAAGQTYCLGLLLDLLSDDSLRCCSARIFQPGSCSFSSVFCRNAPSEAFLQRIIPGRRGCKAIHLCICCSGKLLQGYSSRRRTAWATRRWRLHAHTHAAHSAHARVAHHVWIWGPGSRHGHPASRHSCRPSAVAREPLSARARTEPVARTHPSHLLLLEVGMRALSPIGLPLIWLTPKLLPRPQVAVLRGHG